MLLPWGYWSGSPDLSGELGAGQIWLILGDSLGHRDHKKDRLTFPGGGHHPQKNFWKLEKVTIWAQKAGWIRRIPIVSTWSLDAKNPSKTLGGGGLPPQKNFWKLKKVTVWSQKAGWIRRIPIVSFWSPDSKKPSKTLGSGGLHT